MLFVGLVGPVARHPIAARMARLGAVRTRVDTLPEWDVGRPAAFVVDASGDADEKYWPGLHFLITADPAASLDTADATILETEHIDALWSDRLVPFETRLRQGQRARRTQQATLSDPDPTWAGQARRLIERLEFSVGEQVIRVDHVGSTSVPGLAAKGLIDIQVVVADLETAARVAKSARRAGFAHVPGQWFGTDRHGIDHPEEVVVDTDSGRPVNINIRPIDAPIWRETLLLRDYLRAHDHERDAYATMKRELANHPELDVNDYSVAKMPWISAALDRADQWAAATNRPHL